MNSHIRINLNANYTALHTLNCSAYKVLMCLCSHADNLGRCFPGKETIAKECDLHIQTVFSALKTLLMGGYTLILRKRQKDPFTGLQLPTVIMVSPHFLEIGDDDRDEALRLWGKQNTKISYINQQQEPVPLTNTINQYQNQQQQLLPESVQPQTAKTKKTKKTKTPDPATTTNQQRSENRKRSGIVKKYTNPLSIVEPLPDGLQEQLASQINAYTIPLPMARGFIFKYGFELVQKTAAYYEFCRRGQSINNPGGFFRDLLEHGAIDVGVMAMVDKTERDYTGGEYNEYVES